MPGTQRPTREVVSFVRRSGRMNDSQQRAWERHQDWVIEVPTRGLSTSVAPDAAVDWAGEFGRTAPLVVEVGGGTGHLIAAQASQHPEWNLIGFEVHQPSVANTLSRLGRAGVDNVRLVVANATEALDVLFDLASISELWTFFPDPWQKARHHKRRLVTSDFADLVASRLAPGGLWRLATDWADYATWIGEVLDPHPAFVNEHGGPAPRWAGRPVTKFEGRALAAGRPVTDFTYRRLP